MFFTDKAASIDWGNHRWWRLNRLGGSSKTGKGLWVVRCGYFKVGSHFTIKMVAIYIYIHAHRERGVSKKQLQCCVGASQSFSGGPIGESLGGGFSKKEKLQHFQDQKECGPKHQRTLDRLAAL